MSCSWRGETARWTLKAATTPGSSGKRGWGAAWGLLGLWWDLHPSPHRLGIPLFITPSSPRRGTDREYISPHGCSAQGM